MRYTRTAVLAGLACWGSVALAQTSQNSTAPRPTRRFDQTEQTDLAKDNFNRVAASAEEIRQILAKDAGLLVELKKLIAKEVTDNGQVIQDSDLTDQAVFDRLGRDVLFRSAATRLLQRYGYLLPSFNPDSDLAKQQEFVLKERARKLVQIEAEEDARARQPQRQLQQTQMETDCDPVRDVVCDQGTLKTRERNGLYPEGSTGEPGGPQNTRPGILDRPAEPQNDRSPELLRAAMPNQAEHPSTLGSDSLGGDIGELTPISTGASSLQAMNALSGGLSPQPGSGLPNGSVPVLPDRRTATDWDQTTANGRTGDSRFTRRNRKLPEPEIPTTVRRPNPYSDIPSLFDMYVQAAPAQKNPERFGLEVFRNTTADLNVIPMDLPVGPDYVVGPGDGLAIDLWGGVSQRFSRVVDREGRVSLPEVGPVLVAGKSLGVLQQSLQQVFRTEFRDVSADVSLSRLRTVRVYVVGDVREPGAYDVSSLSTPLNALFAAGGVKAQGSLRHLKHYRGSELVEEVDAYDLLLHGVRGEVKRLENGDTLMVPPIGQQITIDGTVRRPAIYELRDEATLADALELAGGILPTATLRHIEVKRIEAHEKRTMLTVEVPAEGGREAVDKQLQAFKVRDGDEIHIFPIASYNENGIYLQGHVLRPGRYSFHEGLKLTDIIGSYKDLLPEPAPHYAEIIRLNAPDFRPSVESFDLSAAMANPAAAPKLEPLDTVRVFSRYDFEAAPLVWVGGEVRSPGQYRTNGQAHLRDAIHQAGGVSPDAALDAVQLFRTESDGTMKILSVNLGEALAGNPVDNLLLQPRDRILINRNLAQVDPPTVNIRGEVAKPGRYPLTGNMRVEDLIRVAGGMKRSAYSDSADLTRVYVNDKQKEAGEHIEVSLAGNSGESGRDLPLHNGDVLTVRQVPGWNDLGAAVTLRGELEHPGSYGIKPGERLSSVLERAGGFGSQAYPYGAVLMRTEVRELEMQNRLQLLQRVKAEQSHLRMLPDGDEDQKNAKLNAIARTETTLAELQANAPVGRVVIHIDPNLKRWKNSPADVALRDGDVLMVPKQANYITVNGQVFNPTAVSAQPGRSAKWYLSQAGGFTALADKSGVFVIRADGSVIAAKNNSSGMLFSGNPLNAVLRPGDAIVVPEKTPKIGGRNWATVMQTAQVASSLALAVAYIHP